LEVNVKKLAFAAILLAAPLAARAEMGLRLGLDATVANHDANGTTHFITDNWPLGADVMLSYWTPGEILAIDLELGEAFVLNPPPGAGKRQGTVLRPGIRLSPPVLPLYLRAAIPILVEVPSPYDKAKIGTYGLRLGAGFTVPLILFKLYFEGDVDFPLGGGTPAPAAFSNWNLVLNGGLDFRF
jgi:hypothetical protein